MGSITSIFFLLLLSFRIMVAHGDEEADFFRDCPPQRCSSHGPVVRYPLRLKSTPTSCGFPGLDLTCSGNETLLILPSTMLKVTAIDYNYSIITTESLAAKNPCPLANLSLISNSYFAGTGFQPFFSNISLLSCSGKTVDAFTEFNDDFGGFAGPISCLSGADDFVYVVSSDSLMESLPLDCNMATSVVTIPSHLIKPFTEYSLNYSIKDSVDAFAAGGRELSFNWDWGRYDNENLAFREWVENGWFRDWEEIEIFRCRDCEAAGSYCWFSGEANLTFCASSGQAAGSYCWFSREANRTFCSSSGHHGPDARLITGTSVGGLFVIISVAIISFYISRKSDEKKKAHLKVEKFLAMYKTTNPTRYTYADIKKITKRFRHKLGQGGFGSVYKGELPNGISVAIKILEKSRGEGEEFTNEVATVGGIHHINVVRLLGFCSEGTRYALVYEFLPNESLEKFIFSKEPERHHLPLRMVKLQEIALGVARGIEYLHQGCNQRILHFDIKPHNILLDHDFNPKISDFGLAKLCSREDSLVTMTAARGTLGYIAPELYSRNFGTVSYKSDVYSFGMLVFEMVGGRRTIDPAIENQSEIYFPEWVYNQLINGQDIGLTMDLNEIEEENAKKLSIVALWCIQWSPTDRPSMTKVVEMLIANLSSLQLPPKPFVSSTDPESGAPLNVVLNVNSTI